jgi:hypothetical protein
MHNIEENDRQEGTEQAWHHLTVIRPDFSLSNNWLLEWDVEPRQTFIRKQSGDLVEVPFRQLVCTDNETILVGYPYNPETYKPLLNSEFLKLAQDCVAGTQHKLVSAGSVRGRGRTFLSFKIEGLESFRAGGRAFDAYLNFGNGHDKSSVIWANTSNTCSVCDNTFSANLYSAMRSGSEQLDGNRMSARLRHTINFDAKLPDIVDLVEKAVGVQAEFAQAFESLADKPCTPAVARNVYAGFIAAPDVQTLSSRGRNLADQLVDLFAHGRGNRGETRADVFSGVTDYYSNLVGRDAQKRFVSSEFGNGAQRKRDMWAIVNDDEAFSQANARGEKLLVEPVKA